MLCHAALPPTELVPPAPHSAARRDPRRPALCRPSSREHFVITLKCLRLIGKECPLGSGDLPSPHPSTSGLPTRRLFGAGLGAGQVAFLQRIQKRLSPQAPRRPHPLAPERSGLPTRPLEGAVGDAGCLPPGNSEAAKSAGARSATPSGTGAQRVAYPPLGRRYGRCRLPT